MRSSRAVNWDSQIQAGLASPSPVLKGLMACFKAENLLYWTHESTGTCESKGGEFTSPKSWTCSSTSENSVEIDFYSDMNEYFQ